MSSSRPCRLYLLPKLWVKKDDNVSVQIVFPFSLFYTVLCFIPRSFCRKFSFLFLLLM